MRLERDGRRRKISRMRSGPRSKMVIRVGVLGSLQAVAATAAAVVARMCPAELQRCRPGVLRVRAPTFTHHVHRSKSSHRLTTLSFCSGHGTAHSLKIEVTGEWRPSASIWIQVAGTRRP
jgi:hypothetical protein